MKLNLLVAAAIAAGGIVMYMFHRPSPDALAAAVTDLVATMPEPNESSPPRADTAVRVDLPPCPPTAAYCPTGEENAPLLLSR